MKRKFRIITSTGFARPATLLVSISRKYTSKMFLEYQGKCVDLKSPPSDSLEKVMLLGIRPGDDFYIWADGTDEYHALKSIEDHFIDRNLLIDLLEII